MKSRILCLVMLIAVMNLQGASTSTPSPDQSRAETSTGHAAVPVIPGGLFDRSSDRYVASTMGDLDASIVDLALAHLPPKVKVVANMIANESLKSDCILFYGPPGTAKTTSARAIGQRYYPGRTYVFKGSDLLGNQYINSAKMTLDANFKPIISAARTQPQLIVIDEFQKFAKKHKRDSAERDRGTTHFWSLMDEMHGTSNIILIGTCNKMDKLAGPLGDRFIESARYEFDRAPQALYADLLRYYLSKPPIVTGITNEEDIMRVVGGLSCGVRKIEQLVREAHKLAFARGGKGAVITIEDMENAYSQYRSAAAAHPESWEKFLKRHQQKIIVGGILVTVSLAVLTYYLQKLHREEDLARHATERLADEVKRELCHEEALSLTAKCAADQLAQLLKFENDRRAAAADNCWRFVPRWLWHDLNSETPEVQALALERQERRYAVQNEAVKEAAKKTLLAMPAVYGAIRWSIATTTPVACSIV